MKGIGACLLISSSIYYGASMIREESRKLTTADAVAELIRYIRDNIEHFMTPLPDILDSFENKTLENCGFLHEVRRLGLRETAEKLSSVIGSADREVTAAFRDFCVGIGGGYKDDEVRLCDYTLERIGRRIGQMKSEHAGKVKIYRTLPPLFALSAILILV